MSELDKSWELASKGCEAVIKSDNYIEAISLLSKAIELKSTDFRYYANRSLVFNRLKQFRFALIDANIAIKLNDKHAVSFVRKASALNGLRKYREAEVVAKHAMYLDPTSRAAVYELLYSRKKALISMGFEREDVLQIIPKCYSISDGFAKLMFYIQTGVQI